MPAKNYMASKSTLKWHAKRSRCLDSERNKWLGPRLAEYILLWECLPDDEWRSTSDLAVELRGSPSKVNGRQVRRILMALESVGLVESKRALSGPFLWRRAQ